MKKRDTHTYMGNVYKAILDIKIWPSTTFQDIMDEFDNFMNKYKRDENKDQVKKYKRK